MLASVTVFQPVEWHLFYICYWRRADELWKCYSCFIMCAVYSVAFILFAFWSPMSMLCYTLLFVLVLHSVGKISLLNCMGLKYYCYTPLW